MSKGSEGLDLTRANYLKKAIWQHRERLILILQRDALGRHCKSNIAFQTNRLSVQISAGPPCLNHQPAVEPSYMEHWPFNVNSRPEKIMQLNVPMFDSGW